MVVQRQRPQTKIQLQMLRLQFHDREQYLGDFNFIFEPFLNKKITNVLDTKRQNPAILFGKWRAREDSNS